MTIDNKLEWVKPWLNLPFYKEKCMKPTHESQYPTFYCTLCKEPLMCKLCWATKSIEHQCHRVLKVCTSSRRASINIKEISKYLDVSGIQENIINYKKVVYLNSNEKEKKLENSHSTHKHGLCEVCKGRLNHSYYRFCSIACKLSTMKVEVAEENNLPAFKKSDAKRKTMMADCGIQTPEKSDVNGSCSFRKRSRKGIPHQAPFF